MFSFETSAIPTDYLCPIGLGLMTDPVVDANGHTFERANISKWYLKSNISPITHQAVAHTFLTPNVILKRQILEFQESSPTTSHTTTTPTSTTTTTPTLAIPIQLPELSYRRTSKDTIVEVDARQLTSQTSQHFLFLVDTSGSMGSGVSGRDEEDREVDYGMSLMDIVKHACRTLFKVLLELGDIYYITIISFNSCAEREIVFTKVGQATLGTFERVIDGLRPGGTTNIWDAIRLTFQTMKELNETHSSLIHKPILFTDGVPNNHPFMDTTNLCSQYPKHIQDCKRRYGIDCHINTIGFGKGSNLDMELLSKISGEQQGISSYVSDLSMYNTVWLYIISNLLNETDFISPRLSYQLNGETHYYNLNKLLKGQNKIVFLPSGSENICFESHQLDSQPIQPIESIESSSSSLDETEVLEERYRYKMIEWLGKLLNYGLCRQWNVVKNEISGMVKEIRDLQIESPLLENYVKDLESSGNRHEGGQIMLALSREDWFEDWGIHYLLALRNGHEMKCKTNFKDHSLCYDTPGVRETLTIAEQVFGEMDPPKASNRTARSQVMQTTTTMYRASGGCWSGECLITLANDNKLPISELQKGMCVKTTKGFNTVKCLIEIQQPETGTPMCVLNETNHLITPYHPIYYDDKWCFPGDIFPIHPYPIETVYNMVLENKNDCLIRVDDWICPTFGHGVIGEVIQHDYFGTYRIIEDLEKKNGFQEGRVKLNYPSFERDLESGVVCGLVN